MASEDFVWLQVVALSGRGIIKVRVPLEITSEELYDVAGSGFADSFSFKLLYEERRDLGNGGEKRLKEVDMR